jgi:outer membrane protein assembly factor BamB
MPLPALLALLALSPAAPQDWPQFLGPDRTGVVPGSGWEAVGAAEPLWTRNVGLGYSCPSIVGEHLVTMGFHPEENQDVVLCLDPETGEELWWHAYEATDAPRYHGGGTLTTPTIAGGVVYTVNRHGRAFALDLETGEPRWERDYRTELELERTFHGYCASPVVLADRILLVLGGEALAVQRDDGEVLWRTEDHGDGAYTNPTVFVRQGRTLAAVMLGQTLLVLDMADGSVVHRMEWPLQGNAVHVAQPLLIDDRLLISSAYEKGAAMLRLGDALEPEVLWTSRKLRNKVTGLYLYDGHVYGFDESVLKCFDLEGNERWRERGLGMGALSIAGGRLRRRPRNTASSRGARSSRAARTGRCRCSRAGASTSATAWATWPASITGTARRRATSASPARPPRPPACSARTTRPWVATRYGAPRAFDSPASGRSWGAASRALPPRWCSGLRTAGASASTRASSCRFSTARSPGSRRTAGSGCSRTTSAAMHRTCWP